MRISPSEVRSWSLPDLVEMTSDMLNKFDNETYAYYFPEG